jgi:hypothetical protein
LQIIGRDVFRAWVRIKGQKGPTIATHSSKLPSVHTAVKNQINNLIGYIPRRHLTARCNKQQFASKKVTATKHTGLAQDVAKLQTPSGINVYYLPFSALAASSGTNEYAFVSLMADLVEIPS